VVPSAGLKGRGVVIEYPRGPWVCAEAIRLEANKSVVNVFKFGFCAIGSSFWAIRCR